MGSQVGEGPREALPHQLMSQSACCSTLSDVSGTSRLKSVAVFLRQNKPAPCRNSAASGRI